MKRYSILCFLFLVVISSKAQEGCTDIQALNYDENAVSNDGSCQYAITNYAMEQRAVLPEAVAECSGLAFFDGELWAHNDSYMPNYIHQLDTTNGSVLRSVFLTNYANEDWEDFADSDTHLYIGDFGNNWGNRTNLSIGRLAKSDLSSDSVEVELIEFSFEDQTNFTADQNNHNFDCEAFFFLNDSLHLFSKNWANKQTKHYVIPASPGQHTARLVETFNVEALISSADIDENGTVSLLGYTETGFVVMWVLFDYPSTLFFEGNKREINLGSGLTNSVPEGIAFAEGQRGFVGSESFSVFPARLLSFSVGQWITAPTVVALEENKASEILVKPNPFESTIQIDTGGDRIESVMVLDFLGKIHLVRQWNNHDGIENLDLSSLPIGNYILRVGTTKQTILRRIQKQ